MEPLQYYKPPHFAVSGKKLIIMIFATFGLYHIYWTFKHWACIRRNGYPDIKPAWRTIFMLIFCYSLFRHIKRSLQSVSPDAVLHSGLLASAWVILTVLSAYDELWLLGLPAPFLLLPVQNAANTVNALRCPRHDPNDHFSGWNVAAIVLAVGAYGLAITQIILG